MDFTNLLNGLRIKMEITNPWCVAIGETQFIDEFNIDAMLEEVMSHPDVMKSTKVGSLRINKKDFPKVYAIIDQHLRQEVKTYVEAIGYRLPKLLKWSSWLHFCFHGTGLVPHYHMGDAHLATILYLTDSKAALVLRDPRANFVRHFPQDMQAIHFADQQVIPRKGKFVIVPTYVDHYVMSDQPDFRVSLAIDWCFK